MAKVTDFREAAQKMRQSKRNGKGCPICGQPATPACRPFCSRRCAQIDLGRWLGGRYRIETDERPEFEGGPDADYADRQNSGD